MKVNTMIHFLDWPGLTALIALAAVVNQNSHKSLTRPLLYCKNYFQYTPIGSKLDNDVSIFPLFKGNIFNETNV